MKRQEFQQDVIELLQKHGYNINMLLYANIEIDMTGTCRVSTENGFRQ